MSNKDVEKESHNHCDDRNDNLKRVEERLVTIGHNIQLVRNVKGKSQIHIALLAGMSPSKLSRIESGTVSFTVRDLILICEALDVSVSKVVDEDLEELSIPEKAHQMRLQEFDKNEYKRVLGAMRKTGNPGK